MSTQVTLNRRNRSGALLRAATVCAVTAALALGFTSAPLAPVVLGASPTSTFYYESDIGDPCYHIGHTGVLMRTCWDVC